MVNTRTALLSALPSCPRRSRTCRLLTEDVVSAPSVSTTTALMCSASARALIASTAWTVAS